MTLIDRDRLVCVGKVLEPHGLKGELKVRPLTSDPEYYTGCKAAMMDGGTGLRPYRIRNIRFGSGRWIVALEGVEDRDAANALRGAEMLLDEAQLKPLGENEYFSDDLIGCEVFDMSGQFLGRVTGIIETGANDVLEVESGAGKTLVPVTGEVVKTITVRERRIEIDPLPGSFGRKH